MRKSKPRICFRVQRNGIPIRQHFLKGGVRAGIAYNSSFAEAEACIAANLNYYKWRLDEYPQWLKAEVVAWHQLSKLIDSHVKAAEAKHVEKMSKKGRK
jgi:hypothetical protein